MMNKYKTAADVVTSAMFSRLVPPKPHGLDRVLKSTRLEDAIYSDLRSGQGDELASLEAEGVQKLSTFMGLTRDSFQAMYSLNPRRNDDADLSTLARKFNRFIVDDMMNSETYPTLKSLCEGRELPAYEASQEFMENISSRLDELLQAAGGDQRAAGGNVACGRNKGVLHVLEKLESQQEQLLDDLQLLAEQKQRGEMDNPVLNSKLVDTANKSESKARQVAALNQMVDDNLRKNKAVIQTAIQDAARAAQDKAQEVTDILMSWGDDSGNPMGRTALNQEVLSKVRGNKKHLDIAKYLGRFRELITSRRKNSFAYGRGEKYSIELGNDLQRTLSSEFALLATPETVPLFLKKYQRKGLKQYQRREAVYKGSGDIIVCLDESSSTSGEPAAWGKALALALLEVARVNRRSFALVHFSGKGCFKTDVYKDSRCSLDEVMATADVFLGGGTDYETPLREALRLIEDDFQNADVVFITDGECAVSESFTKGFCEAKTARKFTVTGLLLDKGDDAGFTFSLEPFCDSVYRTSEIVEGEIVREMISGRI